jgi:uncharacterized membrane protein
MSIHNPTECRINLKVVATQMEIDACKLLNIIPSLSVRRSALITTSLIIIANFADCAKSNSLSVELGRFFTCVQSAFLLLKFRYR